MKIQTSLLNKGSFEQCFRIFLRNVDLLTVNLKAIKFTLHQYCNFLILLFKNVFFLCPIVYLWVIFFYVTAKTATHSKYFFSSLSASLVWTLLKVWIFFQIFARTSSDANHSNRFGLVALSHGGRTAASHQQRRSKTQSTKIADSSLNSRARKDSAGIEKPSTLSTGGKFGAKDCDFERNISESSYIWGMEM